jgi:hypothetical protein
LTRKAANRIRHFSMVASKRRHYKRLHFRLALTILIILKICNVSAGDAGKFKCPETNGFFPDPEQCDKYYECVGNVPETKFCPDGLLFEASDPNSELCDYPFNVECGTREFVRKYIGSVQAMDILLSCFFVRHGNLVLCQV